MRVDGRVLFMTLALAAVWATGCGSLREETGRPSFDRPFPLGQVTDSIWETQQTNAEASDFVFYDHEFTGDT